MKLMAHPGEFPPDSSRHTIALLGAFCLFLSAVEYMIPKPVPFLRIGLANVPLMIALDLFSWKFFALLALIKVLGQALITGTLFSYVFLLSLAGTCSSAAVMYLLTRGPGRDRIGFVGIGVSGAMVSNISQLGLARFFILGEGVKFLLPPFLISGMVTGIALGLFCEAFTARSRWYHRIRGLPGYDDTRRDLSLQTGAGPGKLSLAGAEPAELALPPQRAGEGQRPFQELFSSRDLCIAGFFMTAAFLANPSVLVRCLQFLLFWVFAGLGGKKNNPLLTFSVMLGIVFFNLLVPYGRVLAEIGPLRITQGSLLGGIRRAVTLEGLIMLSRASIRPDLRFPGFFGALMGESIRIFGEISRRKGALTRKGFIEGLDRLMETLSAEGELSGEGGREEGPPNPERRGTGIILLAAAVLLTAGLTAAGFILLPSA
jgi:heptaprenyl diphosphate synthase